MDFETADISLGHPLPNSPHAVSVSLPTWQDVVDYEEGDLRVHATMKCGYPRFFLHPTYAALCKKYEHHRMDRFERIYVYPSRKVAEKALNYVGCGRLLDTNEGVTVAFFPPRGTQKAKEFWQHTGLIVSSRQAENILHGRASTQNDATQELKNRIAGLNGAAPNDVYLFPTGIAAVFAAYEAVTAKRGTRTVQLGFPYIDILKIQQRFGQGAQYVRYDKPQDLHNLRNVVRHGNIAGVFCEVPGNPLLRTIDMPWLNAMLSPKNIPLVVDDTLGPQSNINLSGYADIRVTSLTKAFSGVGDVMGGALVLNKQSRHYNAFKEFLAAHHEELLYPEDAQVLLDNSHDFTTRLQRMNRNGAKLTEFLRGHPAIDEIFYPQGDDIYESIKQRNGGYGSLFSITLKDPSKARHFYDALKIAKGPSLGTNFTLASPFTLLAHYGELDWARGEGVSPELIRVSAGLEKTDDLLQRFDVALHTAMRPQTHASASRAQPAPRPGEQN